MVDDVVAFENPSVDAVTPSSRDDKNTFESDSPNDDKATFEEEN
jgi:hypothetical protein